MLRRLALAACALALGGIATAVITAADRSNAATYHYPAQSSGTVSGSGSITSGHAAAWSGTDGTTLIDSGFALSADAAAGTASLRTLGTGSTQALPGNSALLSQLQINGVPPTFQQKINLLDGSGIMWTAANDSGSSRTNVTADLTNIIANNHTFSGQITLQAAQFFTGSVTPATLTTSQNDYGPGVTTTSLVLQNATSDVNVTGLNPGADGHLIFFQNISTANTITLTHQDAASSAINRFILPRGESMPIAPGMGVFLYYQGGIITRWRAVGGAPMAVASGTAGYFSGADKAKLDAYASVLMSTIAANGTVAGTARGVIDFRNTSVITWAIADDAGNNQMDLTPTLVTSPSGQTPVGTTRTLTCGNALTGCGDLSADRTLAVTTSPASQTPVGTTRTLTAGTGIATIGDLSADRTIAISHRDIARLDTLQTTNGTLTVLYTVTLPTRAQDAIYVECNAFKSTDDQSAYYGRVDVIRNNAGTAAEVTGGARLLPTVDAESDATWGGVSISTTGATYSVNATGVASQTIDWRCTTTGTRIQH